MSGLDHDNLKISWYHPSGEGILLDSDEELFKLKFVAKQKISNILELFSINNRTFASELHQQSSNTYRFELALNSPETLNSSFKLYQNTPNPFKDYTIITIEIPTAIDAEVVLHDNFGRSIRTIAQKLEKGLNQIRIDQADLSAGVYYYTVKAGEYADTKRMMIAE